MKSLRPARPTIATAVLLASLLSSPAGGAIESTGPSTAQPQFYLLHAEALGYPLDAVAVHFEYRSGERVVGADDVLLRFASGDAVLVPIPPSFWSLAGATEPDLELLVLAKGLLLARFDRTSLLAYNRTLGYTHAEQIAALSGKPPTSATPSVIARAVVAAGRTRTTTVMAPSTRSTTVPMTTTPTKRTATAMATAISATSSMPPTSQQERSRPA
jgi:hypothetical protein